MGYYANRRSDVRYPDAFRLTELESLVHREREQYKERRRQQQYNRQQAQLLEIARSVQAYWTTEQGDRPISPVRNAILPQSPRITGFADDPDDAPERYGSKLERMAEFLDKSMSHVASCDCTCAQCVSSRPKESFPWDNDPHLKDEDRGWLKRMWTTAELGPWTWVTTQNIR